MEQADIKVEFASMLPKDIVKYLYNYKYTVLYEENPAFNYPFLPYFYIQFPECSCCHFALALFINGDGSWYVLECSRGFDFTVGYLPNPIKNLDDLKLILDFYECNGRGYP